MKIKRIGKSFVIVEGIREITSFDNFDIARRYLADKGNKDATGKLSKGSNTIHTYLVKTATSRNGRRVF